MINYRYRFKFEKGPEKVFEIKLDEESLNIQNTIPAPLPEWARLEVSKCENCPLSQDSIPFCPTAASIVGLTHSFAEVMSIEPAEVIVESPARNYYKKVPAQQGLFSLLGIYMATSGCPVTQKLRPMVRHHLPFSSGPETIYRVLTMYLTAQYYRMQKGLTPDWELKELVHFYEDIKKVNVGFSNRLRQAVKQESLTNAVVILDTLASLFQHFSKKSVDSLENLFKAYLK